VLTRVSARVQVVYVVAGTLIAAALVAMLGDDSGHRALMMERQTLAQQMAGSWKADNMPMQSLQMKAANARLLAKQEATAVQQPVPVPAATSLDDMKAGNGDVKEEVSAKLFGSAAGMGGNSYEPPYEPEEDADVGVCPQGRATPRLPSLPPTNPPSPRLPPSRPPFLPPSLPAFRLVAVFCPRSLPRVTGTHRHVGLGAQTGDLPMCRETSRCGTADTCLQARGEGVDGRLVVVPTQADRACGHGWRRMRAMSCGACADGSRRALLFTFWAYVDIWATQESP
jgi:hypothetical protein